MSARRAWPVVACVAVFGCEGTMSADASDAGPTSDRSTFETDAASQRDGGDDTSRDLADAGAASEAGEGRVPMFVAQGMMGRSTISCDDGRTWVADRAFDTEGDPIVCSVASPVVCGETPCTYLRHGACATHDVCDCGHHTGFGKGVAYGNGWFVATWGWGHPGTARRSRDGVIWEDTLSETVGELTGSFGGLAFGNGRFVLSSRSPRWSVEGMHWTSGGEADFRGPDGEITWSVRKLVFIDDPDASRFIASAGPPSDVLISEDGETWRRPAERPDGCVEAMGRAGGVGYGDGITVAIGDDGRLCTSTDGGDHWTAHPGGVGADTIWSRVVIWNGSEFMAWGAGADHDTRLYTSTDGIAWTGTVTHPARIRLGPIARSEATGTFVSTGHIWNDYERQRFYRSAEGVTWEALADGAFEPSHGIFELAFGYGEPSAVCPEYPRM